MGWIHAWDPDPSRDPVDPSMHGSQNKCDARKKTSGVKVSFDYEAANADELSLKEGEIIENVIQSSGGWCRGQGPT